MARKTGFLGLQWTKEAQPRPAGRLEATTTPPTFESWAKLEHERFLDTTPFGYMAGTYEEWLQRDRERLESKYQSLLPERARAGYVAPPAAAPDATDKLVREARTAAMLRLLAGRGRRSTFLTGPEGLVGPMSAGRGSLLGGL